MATSSNWIAHIDAYVDPDGPATKQATSRDAISKLLLQKTITIQQFVVVTGKYLTSTDNAIRARGLLLLAELLIDLADTPMEDTSIHSLASFFTDRLQDWHSLRPALIGSTALLKRAAGVGAVQSEDVEKMGKVMIHELDVQSLSQRDRMLSLELYEYLFTLHGSSVEQLGGDIVFAIIAAIEEEKDPRCILIAFRLVEHMARLFPDPDGPFGESAEDIFDIVSRYFPIAFNAPQDPRGITREDLSSALLRVFTATPLFAPFCFQVLLEKLSSTLQSAKLDALNYMGHCALSFGPAALSEHASSIWIALKSEIFRLAEGDGDQKAVQLSEEAYECLTRCVEASQKGKSREDPVMSDLLRLVLEDACVEDLLRRVKSEFEGNLDSPTGTSNVSSRTDAQLQAIGRMLGAAAKASSSSCYIVSYRLLTRLLPTDGLVSPRNYEAHHNAERNDDLPQKIIVSLTGLEGSLQILEGAKHIAYTLTASTDSDLNANERAQKRWLEPVVSAAPLIIRTFSQVAGGKAVTELVKLGVTGLQALLSFPASLSPLSEDQRKTVLTILTMSLLDKTRGSDVKDQALGAILAASRLEKSCARPQTELQVNVPNIVIPKLLEAVQNSESPEYLKSHLRALVALSVPLEDVRRMVLEALGKFVSTNLRQTLVTADRSFEFGKMILILECLSQEIIPSCKTGSLDQMAACDMVFNIWSIVKSTPESVAHISTDILLPLTAVVRVTVQRCGEDMQKEVLAVSLDRLENSRSCEQISNSITPPPSIDFTEAREWRVALVAAVIVGLLPSVVFAEREMLLRTFVSKSVAGFDTFIREIAAQAAASLLNKWQDNAKAAEQGNTCTLDDALSIAIDKGWMPMVNEIQRKSTGDVQGSACIEVDEEKVTRSVYALSLAGKGLGMRGHSRIAVIAGVLLRVLQSQDASSYSTSSSVGNSISDPDGMLERRSKSAVGWAAAEGFGVIVKDHPSYLTKNQNAVIRPLYKQRFFTSILPPLLEALRLVGSQSSRIWFYRAFGSLLSGTPLAAVMTEGKRIFPLILEGLSTLYKYPEDSENLLRILLALSSFLVDESHGRSIAADYVQSMVTRLVPLIQYESLMGVRESALQCLAAIVGLPFTRVFPVKSQVMRAITVALDDKKRLVRREAVRCRQVWSAVSST